MKIALLLLAVMTIATAAPRIEVHGHRGARSLRPENTLPAFQYAIEQGVDVLEMDMAVTKDDIVVISHDPVLPAFCEGPDGATRVIRQLTFAELQRFDCGSKTVAEFPQQRAVPGTRMPSLDQVFAATKSAKVRYNIETKIFKDKPELTPTPERFVELFLATVKKHQLESRVILQSFDPRTLVAMAKLDPKIERSMLTPTSALDALKNWVEACREGGNAKIISPHHMTVTKGRVEEAHQAGLTVVPWTANEASQWQKLVDAGVDAIITDDPAALIAWLKSKGLR
jgi:glycerophosphoryl diester phosphodiesterase